MTSQNTSFINYMSYSFPNELEKEIESIGHQNEAKTDEKLESVTEIPSRINTFYELNEDVSNVSMRITSDMPNSFISYLNDDDDGRGSKYSDLFEDTSKTSIVSEIEEWEDDPSENHYTYDEDESRESIPKEIDASRLHSEESYLQHSLDLNKQKFINKVIGKLRSQFPEHILPPKKAVSENSFIQRKIHLLKEKDESFEKTGDIHRIPDIERTILNAEKTHLPVAWKEKLSWMALDNKIHKMKEGPEHVPKNCPVCKHKTIELEKHQVLKQLIGRVQSKLTDTQLEDHLIIHNSINLIGEISRSLPKLNIHR